MNKKLLCTAVGGALALGAGAAQAYTNVHYYEILVPYVVKDTNRTTVVTVMVTNDNPGTYAKIMHLQYWSKSTTDANTAACKPSSVTVPVTPNDIVTFDTGGILGYPLFGDSTNPAPLGMGISYAGPQHGYLIVQSPQAYTGPGGNGLQAAYWLELDLANGGAHGDHGFGVNSPGAFPGLQGWTVLYDEPTTSPSQYGTAVNFFPSSVASTVFTVTPIGTAMLTKDNNVAVLQVFNRNSTPVQGAYDRNENGVDGTVPQTVRCVGRLTPSQLMPGVAANAAWAAQGGWGMLYNMGNQGNTAISSYSSDAVVYQVDSSSAAGKFVDNAVRITTYQGQSF